MEILNKIMIFVVLLSFAVYFFLSEKNRFYTWYFVVVLLAFESALLLGNDKGHLYFYVFSLGLLTAFAEIIGKFSDEPIKSLRTPHAVLYFLFNGVIAVFALYILLVTVYKPDSPEFDDVQKLTAVLTAGLGSMLVMRSKLFNVKVKNEDVAVGPDQIINVFFQFMQREIDRVRAQSRVDFVRTKLNNIDFDQVYHYSITMLHAAQEDEDHRVALCKDEIAKLVVETDKQLKSYQLGFQLLDAMGEGFVSKLFDNVPPEWMIRAPLPEKKEEGLLDKIPLISPRQEQPLPYMAYGPNMCSRKIREQLNWSEVEETKFHEATSPKKCTLKGHKLVFNKPAENSQAGLANIVQSSDAEIEGVLYQLSKEAVEFLDLNEKGYRRTQRDVIVDDKVEKGYLYVAESQREELKPEKGYLEIILEGAIEHQLSQKYIDWLKTVETVLPPKSIVNGSDSNRTGEVKVSVVQSDAIH